MENIMFFCAGEMKNIYFNTGAISRNVLVSSLYPKKGELIFWSVKLSSKSAFISTIQKLPENNRNNPSR